MPPGEAPELIKKEWIGLELPIEERPASIEVGVVSGKIGQTEGYFVRIEEALRILETKSPAAAQWWRDNTLLCPATKRLTGLIFSTYVCELI
jgi:hypothetical protein